MSETFSLTLDSLSRAASWPAPMACIQGLLGQLAGQVEGRVKPALSGLTGMFVRGYLPQAWVVKTENETVTFHVDTAGNARAVTGLPRQPDVTIQGSHRAISAALQQDRATAAQYANELRVSTHTNKGATAWGFLRKELGF